MTRVCHMSSAHCGLDVRIFHKECVSIASAGFDTHLVIVAKPEDVQFAANKGVTVHALQAPLGRLSRILCQAWNCYVIGRNLKADIYHFHDPELIPYGILLALSGKKVIYDVHEDVPQDILSKDWIAPWARKILSRAISALEYFGAYCFFSVVAATPFICQRFKKITSRTIVISNFPLQGELDSGDITWQQKQSKICYVGNISRIRGVLEIVRAMGCVRSSTQLELVGEFPEHDIKILAQSEVGWKKVNHLGWQDREGVRRVMSRSIGGLVTLHPIINYIDALPIKMFEYMAAGIPVIASNFPLWCDIVEGNECGICIDPLDPQAIAEAIDYLILHPEEAERMARNGQRAVTEKYNWCIEEGKLLEFYAALSNEIKSKS